jgi:hypothetical protein
MRHMAAEGYSAAQISNAVSVVQPLVESVINGEWDEAEKRAAQAQKAADAEKAGAAEAAEVRKAAAIAAATAQAIQAANEINGDLSPQQRAANTRKANKEAALEQEEAAS